MVELFSQPLFAIIFFIGILIFIHELGHFLVGKFFGIGVEIFSIGFGPTIFGFNHRHTQYQISLLPLGGYVKFAGTLQTEDVPEHFQGREFYRASSFAQACTIFAGPFSNLLLAVLVYMVLGAKGLEHPAPIIGQIRAHSVAEAAGLQVGDKITSVNGSKIVSWQDLQEQISNSPEKKIDFEILRDDKLLHIEVTPQSLLLDDLAGRKRKQGRIGVGYGFLPPYVSVVSGESAAKKAGLHSGFEIKQVKIGEMEFPVLRWDDFLKALELAHRERATSIILEYLDKNEKYEKAILNTLIWSKKQNLQRREDLALSLGIVDTQTTIDSIEEPANLSLKVGDRIISVEGQEVIDVYSLSEFLQKNQKESIYMKVQREEVVLDLLVKLKPLEVQKPEGKVTMYMLPVTFLGNLVAPPPVLEKYTNLFENLYFAVRTTFDQCIQLLSVLGGLFVGEVPLKVLGGPIFIAKIAGDSAKLGLQAFLTTLSLLSINLGILNFLPIPALDGGKLFIVFFEMISRRRVSITFIENFQKIGFVMLLSLMVLATYNDLSRFWTSILKSLVGSFK